MVSQNKIFLKKTTKIKNCPICETILFVDYFFIKDTKMVKCYRKNCLIQLSYKTWNKIKRREKISVLENSDSVSNKKLIIEFEAIKDERVTI